MRQADTLRRSALCSASFIGLALAFATPAYAEAGAAGTAQPTCDPNDPTDPDCQPGPSEVEIESGTNAQAGDQSTITVTGTRIRRPNVESNVPVTSVSAEELTAQGDVNVGDALNDLPSLRSTFSQSNSTRFIGTTGLNVLDLRGLGTSRTLVLVNGRRHITASPGDFLVDVNTIPTDLIERVDVVTGGSSAVYGSDAIAGVVNFVLRRDFEGVRLRAQGGISSEADRGIYFASLTAGENFLDDRLNLAMNLEYVHAEPLYLNQRNSLTGAYSGRCQFNVAEPTAGEPGGSDGVPDQQFFCGVRNANISLGGTLVAGGVNAGTTTTAASFGTSCVNPAILANATLSARCLNPGTPQGQPRIYRFDPNGNLFQDIPALDFRPLGSGNYIPLPGTPYDTAGATLRDTGQIAPGLDRYTANFLARFDVSPAFQPFLEAKYVYIESLQEGQPSFFQSVANTIGAPNIRCQNGFITPAMLASLQGIGYCANPATGTIPLGRFNVDFGGRSELVERETFRVVGGIGGEFNGDWNYEVSFNYGQVDIFQSERNDLVLLNQEGTEFAGFLQAYDSIRLADGSVVCRDPVARAAGCVPINMFGFGTPSQAALDYVNTTSWVQQNAKQYNALAFVNGDSSQIFEFPGGPARFVVGAEWRREEAFLQADPLSAAGGTFFNAFATFDPPPLEVYELFGEIELPILRDVPFAQELTITAAGRYSDYNTSADTTTAYNVNATWAPVSDIRFRANYSRSVRVPTLGDLFTTEGQNFNFVSDPCDVAFINNGANRVANCAALGVPVGFVNTVARAQTIEFLSAGNPNLEEEKSDSYTIGAVITPRWVPGLAITVDYYNITVDNLIATLTAQQILNACVDLPTIQNQFCDLIFPRDAAGFLATPALTSNPRNFARLEAEGIDFEVSYRRRFASGWRFDARGILTYVIERNNFVDPSTPDFGDQQLRELGDPQYAANFSATIGHGIFDLRYSMNYIGEQTIGAVESYFPFQGRPPTNADLTAQVHYPDTFYHALRFSIRPNERFNFYVGVDNVMDTQPPFGLLGTGAGDPFDPIGRYFYAGATVDF